jgi:hypothetical protein
VSTREETSERRPVFTYSPDRRTALILCGTGAHGAYHAGVLRALQEAGVKIDVLAGQGMGAATAAIAAIDGAARLWEPGGVWRQPAARHLYRWSRPLVAAAALAGVGLLALALPLILVTAGLAIPLWPFLVTALASGGAAGLLLAHGDGMLGRRSRGPWFWRALGAPIDAGTARTLFTAAIWDRLRGAAPVPRPPGIQLSRRYAELLTENLGQPGFRELIVVATDVDARRDVVAALLAEPFRHTFLAPRAGRDRRTEVLDLSGVGRDHALDLVAAALTPPFAADPYVVSFAPDSFWRGERHRMCDRPAALNRLIEEVATAGVSQAIVVSAVATAAGPHRLRSPGLDARARLGEQVAADEAAALRDALEMARLRYDSVYVICPAHNPVGPLDLAGAYDEASDRRQDVGELMERAYEDAYRQFIEPIVGASGDHLARPATIDKDVDHGRERVLDDADPRG